MNEPLLDVRGLDVRFRRRIGLTRSRTVHAVRDVSFAIGDGETLALVGESGSGKTTTARAAMRLQRATGAIRFAGADLHALTGGALRTARRPMQMVFQDPYSSLDPSMPIVDVIGEPLEVHLGLKGSAKLDRVAELLDLVHLSPQHAQRYPYEFSGGQRQRIAIARAIALDPQLLVCDEATSALDVSTQNQILNLLEALRARIGISMLFISHNLAVVRHIADRIAVMYLGRIVETGPTEQVFEDPQHPYTRALLSAVPDPNPTRQRERRRIHLGGDIPDPAAPPSGCALHPRCPVAFDRCPTELPHLQPAAGDVWAACHLVDAQVVQ